MVCGRCGEPLGAKVVSLRRAGRRRRWPQTDQSPRLWWLGLMTLLGLSGILAALQLDALPRQPQRDRRGLEERMRRDTVRRQGGAGSVISSAVVTGGDSPRGAPGDGARISQARPG